MEKKLRQKKADNGFVTGTFERYSYVLYFFGQLLFYSLVTGFLQLFLTDSGIPATTVGIIFAVAKVWDAINDPLFGAVVDKTRLKKGRYIPWVRLSGLLIPVTTVLIFLMPSGASMQVKIVWAAAAYMLWDTSYTFNDVPIFALATAMTENMRERDWLFLVRGYTTFAGIIVAGLAIPLLYPNIGWAATAIVISVFAMITMLPVGYAAKERNASDENNEPTLGELARYFVKNKYLLIVNGAAIVASLTNTGAAVGSYVAIYCYGGVEFIALVAIVAAIPALLSIVIVQQIVKKIDKITVVNVCRVIGIALSIITYFVGYSRPAVNLGLIFIASFLTGGAGALGPLFTADCAEYGHFKTGSRAQGIAFSVQTFTAKMTAALSAAIGMIVLGLVGFVEGAGAVQTPETIAWLWKLNTLVPLIGGVLSFLLFLFTYKLKTTDVDLMAQANRGELSREEAMAGFSRQYT